MKRYVTTPWRRVASVFIGAFVGGALLALPALAIFTQGAVSAGNAGLNLDVLFGCFLVCSLAWLIAISVIGVPLWWILEQRKLATNWAAGVCGLSVPPAVVLVVFVLTDVLDPARIAMGFSGWVLISPWLAAAFGIFAGIGFIVGLVMWRCAYRRRDDASVAEQVFS